jgi:hypothetical protein
VFSLPLRSPALPLLRHRRTSLGVRLAASVKPGSRLSAEVSTALQIGFKIQGSITVTLMARAGLRPCGMKLLTLKTSSYGFRLGQSQKVIRYQWVTQPIEYIICFVYIGGPGRQARCS